MRLIITAGPTQVHLDPVRVISNLATGRTGEAIATLASTLGHQVTLLTSRPPDLSSIPARLHVEPFTTPGELGNLLAEYLRKNPPDAIIHSAAVSDFAVGKVTDANGRMVGGEKLDSAHGPFLLELVRSPKLIDSIRVHWGFQGVLVGFKLESGLTTENLLLEAEATRKRAQANLMVANHLESAGSEAFVGPDSQGGYERVERLDLPNRLISRIAHQLK